MIMDNGSIFLYIFYFLLLIISFKLVLRLISFHLTWILKFNFRFNKKNNHIYFCLANSCSLFAVAGRRVAGALLSVQFFGICDGG
jgi:uncharacterized MnhB-related membrane protein